MPRQFVLPNRGSWIVGGLAMALGVLVVMMVLKVTHPPNCFTPEEGDTSWRRQGRSIWETIFCYPIADLARTDISTKAPGWSGQNWEEQLHLVKGATLRYSNLRYAIALRTFFLKADLYQADLSHAYLREADLRKAELQGANLRKANLIWASLSKADLRQADLQEANLFQAVLNGAYLSIFNNCNEGSLRPVTLYKAILSHGWLEKADLETVTDLKGADLSEAHLEEAQLPEAALQGVCLRQAHLQKANLRGAHLGAITITKICDEDLLNVPLPQTVSPPSACNSQRISRHDRDTVLTGADLRDAHLEGAILIDADLRGADLTGAALGEAKLQGADLRETIGLTQEQLNVACVDEKTQLPNHLTRRSQPSQCQPGQAEGATQNPRW